MIRHIGSVDEAWDFIECDQKELASVTKEVLDKDVQDAGFGVIDSLFHRFPGGGEGISYIAIIHESHIAIHTSPENKGVAEITIHTCTVEGTGSEEAPEDKTKQLFTTWKSRFAPHSIHEHAPRERGSN